MRPLLLASIFAILVPQTQRSSIGWLGRQRGDDHAPRRGMVFVGYNN